MIIASLIIGMLLMLPVSFASASSSPQDVIPTLYENYSSGDDAAHNIYGVNWFGQTFNTSCAYSITQICLKMSRTASPGVVTVSIREVSSDVPVGGDLVSTTLNGNSFPTATSSFIAAAFDSECYLEAKKTYAIVVAAPYGDSSNYVKMRAVIDGTYPDGMYVSSDDGGYSWTNSTCDFLFKIYGIPALDMYSAKVFRSFSQSGDWLFVFTYGNFYSPYYGVDPPQSRFSFQLLDGSVVESQVPMSQWGYAPGSIYLSKSEADTLGWGQSYVIRMQSRFDSTIYVDYTLSSSDWIGEDMGALDSWVETQAKRIQEYYDVTLWEYYQRTWVLNDAGGAIFLIGIPGLDQIRPDLFKAKILAFQGTDQTFNNSYQESLINSSGNWTQKFDNVDDSFGAPHGLSAAVFWIIIAFACMGLVTASSRGDWVSGFVVSVLVLFIATLLGMFPIAAMAVFACFCAVLLLRKIWMTVG